MDDDARWRSAGDRIQTLLDASTAGGPVARERAEQLVRELTGLYGAGLERMMRMALTARPELADAFASDDLLASLLLVHDLHPYGVRRRIADALDGVRPYLGSHGGDVHLVDVTAEGTVRLRFSGSCNSCPSSAVTLELAVEDAVRAAAPEISAIEVVAPRDGGPPGPTATVIPAESLLSRVHPDGRRTDWQPVPDLSALAPGEIAGFRVAGTDVLACRTADTVYAYRDRCGACTASMAGARLQGSTVDCPRCGAAFDVVHAGARIGGDGHLEPIPLLVRNGLPSVAVPRPVPEEVS